MTKTNMKLSELMAKHDQGDLLRSNAREGVPDGMNGLTGARHGATGTATARLIPVSER